MKTASRSSNLHGPAVESPTLHPKRKSKDAPLTNPLLSSYLSVSEQAVFMSKMLEVQVNKGDVVIRQGETGNNFFIIGEGECNVSIDGVTIRVLKAGSHCGEIGLVESTARTASVTATSPKAKLLLLHKTHFMKLLGERIVEKRRTLLPVLQQVPVLSKLKPYDLNALADMAVVATYAQNKVICAKGDKASAFRIVHEGSVSGRGKLVQPGQYFGEIEIFTKRAFECDMVASSPRGAICLEWTVEHFVSYVSFSAFLHEKTQQEFALARTEPALGVISRARRLAESSESPLKSSFSADSSGKLVPSGRPAAGRTSKEGKEVFRAACRKILVFTRLEDEQLDQLHEVMVEHAVEPGTVVLVEGEKGNRFYFVHSGTLDAFSNSVSANNGLVRSFESGDSFGELALMYNCPRTATVVARTECVLWSLDRSTFRRILLAENLRKATMYEKFLEKVPLFQPLSREERNRIVDALEPVSYKGGETIITEGDRGEHFYLIETGSVNVTSATHGKLAMRTRGDYFGELSLQTGEPTMATVSAIEFCKLVRMARDAFIRILGPLTSPAAVAPHQSTEEGGSAAHLGVPAQSSVTSGSAPSSPSGIGRLGMRRYDASTRKEISTNPSSDANADMSSSPKPVHLEAGHGGARAEKSHELAKLESLKEVSEYDVKSFVVSADTIGEGGFGKVRIAKHVQTGARYALKQMSKAHLLRMNQAEHAADESMVLDGISNRFIASKGGSFKSAGHLFLMLELAEGGDMYELLEDHGGTIKLADARAYIAQLLLGLEYLHARSIVHRDVKLENLLLAADGTLKLTDFGFAKKIEYRTFTLCGTPEYLAPEVILNKGYGRGVDFWAVGIVLYEMLVGNSPFAADGHLATYQNILFGKLTFPPGLQPKAIELIGKLLERDITKRYGLLKMGLVDIKEHAMFAGYDWDKAPGASPQLISAERLAQRQIIWQPLAETAELQAERKLVPLSEKEDALFANF